MRAGAVGVLCAVCCVVLVSACMAPPASQSPARTQPVPPTMTGPQTSPGAPETEQLPVGLSRPTIVVLVRDIPKEGIVAVTDEMLRPGVTEALTSQAFHSRGFPVVDEATVMQALNKDELLRILQGDDPAASKVGRRSGAEVVVAGTVQQSSEHRTAGSKPTDVFRIELSARAVDAATTRVLGSSEMLVESPSGADSVRKRAADSAAAELAARILDNWKAPSTITEIHADNADYQRVELFKSIIRSEAPGIDSVVTSSLDGQSAVVEVISEESSQQLLARIDRCTTSIPFTVKSISGNRIDIRFLDAPEKCEPDLK
ncbi:MAG TPA: hypothetical protein VMH22_14240 [bacterium]|nr:hypothetical protein [bacterium]